MEGEKFYIKAMEKQDLEKELKQVVEELISKMGFVADINIRSVEEDGKTTIICDIKTEDSNFLIGQYGINLQAVQHIARVMARKRVDEMVNFVLDVNSYRQEKNESIINLANNLAKEALLERRAVVLRPMSSYERRVVHMELSKNDQIRTESIGEGEDRRVVIKPVDLI